MTRHDNSVSPRGPVHDCSLGYLYMNMCASVAVVGDHVVLCPYNMRNPGHSCASLSSSAPGDPLAFFCVAVFRDHVVLCPHNKRNHGHAVPLGHPLRMGIPQQFICEQTCMVGYWYHIVQHRTLGFHRAGARPPVPREVGLWVVCVNTCVCRGMWI